MVTSTSTTLMHCMSPLSHPHTLVSAWVILDVLMVLLAQNPSQSTKFSTLKDFKVLCPICILALCPVSYYTPTMLWHVVSLSTHILMDKVMLFE